MSLDVKKQVLNQLLKERSRAIVTITDNQELKRELKRYKIMIDSIKEQILNEALKIKQGETDER